MNLKSLLNFIGQPWRTPSILEWAQERARLMAWHRWFAYKPVSTLEGKTVRGRYVYRRMVVDEETLKNPRFEYCLKPF